MELFCKGIVEAFAAAAPWAFKRNDRRPNLFEQKLKFGDTFEVAERHSQITDYLAQTRQPNDTAWLSRLKVSQFKDD